MAVVIVLGCDPARPIYRGPSDPCPIALPAAPSVADVSCTRDHCRVDITKSGCGLRLGFDGCDLPSLSATIDSDGALDFEPSDRFGSCQGTSAADALSVSCSQGVDRCEIRVVPQQAPRSFELARRSLLPVSFMTPDDADQDVLDEDDPLEGYALSMVRVAGHVVVTTFDGDFRSPHCTPNDPPNSARFVFVDPVDLTMTSTPAPPCLTFVTTDQVEDTFIGLHEDTSPRVSRFDARGRIVDTAIVAVSEAPEGSNPTAFVASPAGDTLYAAYDHESETPLVRIDAATLETTTVATSIDGAIRGLTFAEGNLIATDLGDSLIHVLDPVTLSEVASVRLLAPLRPSKDAGEVYWSPRQNRLFVTATGDAPALWILDAPLVFGTAPRFVVDPNVGAVMWGFVPPVGDGPLGVVGIGGPPAFDSWLLEVHPEGQRLSPRATPLGRGVATDVLVDGDTRWVLFGWSAEILRIGQP